MPELPHVTFARDRDGLFSPAEVRGLMEIEFQRAVRYGYPVSCMLICVDRLRELGDLYGQESREEIVKEVVQLLRRSTRASDFLGYLENDTLVALFPHTSERGGEVVARRVMDRSRELAFDGGGPVVGVTLSIGISALSRRRELEFEGLLAEARRALERARRRGGGGIAVHQPKDEPTASAPQVPAGYPAPVAYVPVAAPLPNAPAQAAPATGPSPAEISSLIDGMLHEKVRELFESLGEELPDFGGREREVLELAMRKMEEEHRRQIEMLQRRVEKLANALGLTEAELKRAIASRAVDEGVASIYRTVQGLADDEQNVELKREMMSKIFEANVELRRQLGSDPKTP